MKSNRVRFNVGGKKFQTTAATLATAGPDSFFGPLLSNNWNTNTDEDNEVVFIDRDPDCFAVILNLLRTGELSIPPRVSKDSLIREAQFYGVLELVRAASWETPLNGDFLIPSYSITCREKYLFGSKRILGSPNGGFCVADDTSLHVYDWMLHEHPPIHLDNKYGKMNDALWVGTNSIAISTEETVGMFDAVTGKLQYKFVDEKGNQVRGATSMCLGDSNIFHLYQNDVTAIGMLDHESGKSTGTLNLRFPTHLSGIAYNREKSRPISLQTLNGSSNCLLAMRVNAIYTPDYLTGEYLEAQVIDTRDSHSVYNRSFTSNIYKHNDEGWMIRGATLMEDRNTICVMSNRCIGFLDLRFTGDVQWRSISVLGHTPSKVMYHNDRFFMLSSEHLLVYSVNDLAITSKIVPKNVGGGGNSRFEVTDFSISGDRLFTLQSRTNLVDVWETPRPSCLSYL